MAQKWKTMDLRLVVESSEPMRVQLKVGKRISKWFRVGKSRRILKFKGFQADVLNGIPTIVISGS